MSIVSLATPTINSATRHILNTLTALQCPHEARYFTESTHTAKEAAERLACDVGAVASSLVFMALPPVPDAQTNKKKVDPNLVVSPIVLTEPTPILVLCSGSHRANTKKLKRYLGAKDVVIAPMETVLEVTGQPAGGVAPIGHPKPIRTLVDAVLKDHPLLWSGCGDSNTVVSTKFDDLVRITNGEVIEMEKDRLRYIEKTERQKAEEAESAHPDPEIEVHVPTPLAPVETRVCAKGCAVKLPAIFDDSPFRTNRMTRYPEIVLRLVDYARRKGKGSCEFWGNVLGVGSSTVGDWSSTCARTEPWAEKQEHTDGAMVRECAAHIKRVVSHKKRTEPDTIFTFQVLVSLLAQEVPAYEKAGVPSVSTVRRALRLLGAAALEAKKAADAKE